MMIKEEIEHVEGKMIAPNAGNQATAEALPQSSRRKNFPEIQPPAKYGLSVDFEDFLQLSQALLRRCALEQKNDN